MEVFLACVTFLIVLIVTLRSGNDDQPTTTGA
jgi:hypothetical protein